MSLQNALAKVFQILLFVIVGSSLGIVELNVVILLISIAFGFTFLLVYILFPLKNKSDDNVLLDNS